MVSEYLIPTGIVVILIGFMLLIVATLIAVYRSEKNLVEGGFVIFIGPIPIVGATNQAMFFAAITMSVFLIVMFLILNRKI